MRPEKDVLVERNCEVGKKAASEGGSKKDEDEDTGCECKRSG